ncbi:protein cup [Topomyia yanbarensis]|uniref:protein cup n=1 Tax=Topomyia yanbarensis TaxID=2498891 RepID=UPI00273A93E4|nr:protein cup [Topomyia yanbarensis]
MVKVPSSGLIMHTSEQYKDCSSLLREADDPPLEELDPAILSCGLPAIILSDILPSFSAPIRYTASQILSVRKHSLCFRRPIVADDPKIGRFAIWRTANEMKKIASRERKITKSDETMSGQSSKDMSHERSTDPLKYRQGRENGFSAPRFRRNYEFSNRSHHAIVKSYKGGDEFRLQDTVIEEEPEWVSAGPTSRLDTIELRGFDEDLSLNALSTSQSSLEKTNSDAKTKSTGKHISFYDELHHYEHIHSKRGGNGSKQHDTSGRENDVESVAASSTSSSPPARSTPTKGITDYNNTSSNQKYHQQSQYGVNVNNFEEFMKFESLFGTDNDPSGNGQSGSRFSKWFRRGSNSFSQQQTWNQDGRRQSYNSTNDNFGHAYGSTNRFQQDRNQHRLSGSSYNRGYQAEAFDHENIRSADSNTAFKRLVDMVAQSRASSNLIAQQQYLKQLLSKNQQSEILRRMLMKTTVDNVSEAGQSMPQQHQTAAQPPRIPTQRELQFHTQSIMQNALLRKKLQDQRKLLFEQNNQMAVIAAAACNAEPNPTVQQFVQSVCPNIQRSLSVLSQTANNASQCQQFNQSFPGSSGTNNSLFAGGSTQHDLSTSLQQMLLSPQSQRSVGNSRRFGKAQ